jgi:hypothetical protein
MWLSSQKKNRTKRYERVTYRVIVRPLSQGFTGLVIETIDPGLVVGQIVDAT